MTNNKKDTLRISVQQKAAEKAAKHGFSHYKTRLFAFYNC